MSLNDWYEKAVSPEQYRETLTHHKEAFEHIYSQFDLPADETFFEQLKAGSIRTLVLAEPWCGHCMLDIPILLKLADRVNLPVRFLHRDENLELMDRYLTNGKSRSIPIFIFLNENGEELSKWGPIAEKTKQFVEPYKSELPPKDAPDYEERFKVFAQSVSKGFQEREDIWKGVYESIKDSLEQAL